MSIILIALVAVVAIIALFVILRILRGCFGKILVGLLVLAAIAFLVYYLVSH